MFNLPDRYRVDVNIALKDFIPKDLKPNDKKRVKDTVKKVRLKYQIAGEEIPSVVDANYRCQVIQFFDIEFTDIKEVPFLCGVYQKIIKPFCVLCIHDTKEEMFSFAIKRLNQNDNTQIVIEDTLMTEKYSMSLIDSKREYFVSCLDFNEVKNMQDKVSLYREWFIRAFFLMNEKAYDRTETILKGNCWYDSEKTLKVYQRYIDLVNARSNLKKAVGNAERMKANKEIKNAIANLDKEII